jgi:hypothetical protein
MFVGLAHLVEPQLLHDDVFARAQHHVHARGTRDTYRAGELYVVVRRVLRDDDVGLEALRRVQDVELAAVCDRPMNCLLADVELVVRKARDERLHLLLELASHRTGDGVGDAQTFEHVRDPEHQLSRGHQRSSGPLRDRLAGSPSRDDSFSPTIR